MNKKTATLYKEDYSDYGWYYILFSLGMIQAEHLPSFEPARELEGKDLEAFNLEKIKVTLP